YAAQRPGHALPTWPLRAGQIPDRPTWAIHASTYTPPPCSPTSPENSPRESERVSVAHSR
ncbi:hypothetical protein AB0F45_36040, partial [Streptomyces achromogenes]|uniref:hypothetical protein n=1 Tax=Streptomyces achromogenes TaxID=67255 RepID=UPI00347623DD